MTNWKPPLPPFRNYKKDVYLKQAETAQFIHQLGEGTTIRDVSQPVPIDAIVSHDAKLKRAYLKQCMLKYRKITGVGRGIAAVQVGILERFAVIYMPEIKGALLTIINPKITKKSEQLLRFPEGCMSEGPIYAPVTRPAWIEFEYYNEAGEKQYWDKKDDTQEGRLYNRVFQHEIDHMDGTIFLDRADLSKITLDSDPNFYDTATFEEVK